MKLSFDYAIVLIRRQEFDIRPSTENCDAKRILTFAEKYTLEFRVPV